MAFPKAIVFDLDDCLWSPEMFQLPSIPTTPILSGATVTGVKCGTHGPTVSLFPDALTLLSRLHTNHYKLPSTTYFLTASSSEEPTYSRACLANLTTDGGSIAINDLFHAHAIGRTGVLTSRKTTHFAFLKKTLENEHSATVEYSDMLFFDDCNWGDHVGDLERELGVVGIRTPNGITLELFEEGMKKFRKSKE